MPFPAGYLVEHPLPPGICGALSLAGYQLLVDVDGVGAGRLGSQLFLVAAPDPADAGPGPGQGQADVGTQIALHQSKLRDEREAATFAALAAQLGYLRLSGYRLVLERHGLRSRFGLLDPATGAMAVQIPDRHPGRFLGGGATAADLLAAVRSLPPAGPPPDLQNPEQLHQILLALALHDDSLGGAEAAELADRALALAGDGSPSDPIALLEAARSGQP